MKNGMCTIKYILAFLLYYSGLLFALKRIARKRAGNQGLLVLLYHRVNYPDGGNGSLSQITVSPEMFFHQMAYIRKHYQPVSFSEYSSRSMARSSSGRIRVLVTFDDGWRDNYDHAYPILTRHGIPALIFLTTHYIDTKRLFWPERLLHIFSILNNPTEGQSSQRREIESALRALSRSNAFQLDRLIPRNGFRTSRESKEIVERLKHIPQSEVESEIARLEALLELEKDGAEAKERALLDWSEIKCMSEGLIEFGSHTCNHVLLDQVPHDLMRSEIVGSKELLEHRLDRKIEAFAYPNGNYDRVAVEEIQRAGYEAAFTTKPGYNCDKTSPFELKRIGVDDDFARGPTGKFSKCLFEFQMIRHIFGPGLCDLFRPASIKGNSDQYPIRSKEPRKTGAFSIEQ
jgi:peptidoglycan/xylan/chitin deacetylase (PgdA/CDA1 family)